MCVSPAEAEQQDDGDGAERHHSDHAGGVDAVEVGPITKAPVVPEPCHGLTDDEGEREGKGKATAATNKTAEDSLPEP